MIQGDSVGRSWPQGAQNSRGEGKRQVMWLGKRAVGGVQSEEGGGQEASLDALPVTERRGPSRVRLDLWPPQDIDKWHRVSESSKNDDRTGASDL